MHVFQLLYSGVVGANMHIMGAFYCKKAGIVV